MIREVHPPSTACPASPQHALQSHNEHTPEMYWIASSCSSTIIVAVLRVAPIMTDAHNYTKSRCQLRPHMTTQAAIPALSHLPISQTSSRAPSSFNLDPGLITLNQHPGQILTRKNATLYPPCAVILISSSGGLIVRYIRYISLGW